MWVLTKDGDPRAFSLMSRHYSFRAYADGRRLRSDYRNRFLFVGPGERIVLVTSDYDALFVWRVFRDLSGQSGVCCSVFRNESFYLSSDLILAAELFAYEKWPGQRLYTYVNVRRVKSSNPGYCFKCAGWFSCGYTKGGLLILEKFPLGFSGQSHFVTSPAPERFVSRLCSCGCGQKLPLLRNGQGRLQMYVNAAHKQRAYRNR